MKVRTERKSGFITLWNDESGIGLRFKEGENLQRYTSQIVLEDVNKATSEKGVEEINKISALLTEKAATLYPIEFAPLQTPQ